MARAASRFVTTVHARGVASLDGMLELCAVASRPLPLDEMLGELALRIACLLGVDVCSVYLLETPDPGDRRASGELVLRATHGLPPDAVGVVRMRVGEGLTGFAVECLRPVSVARVTGDARNKRFEGLGEERFPALCALPLVDGGHPIGALVVQRREARSFSPREIVLIAAMAPPVLLAIERDRTWRRRVGDLTVPPIGRPQEVTLRGVGEVAGRRLGTVAVRRARIASPAHRAPQDTVAAEWARLGQAFVDVAEEVAKLVEWARHRFAREGEREAKRSERNAARAKLGVLHYVLEDARLRGRAFQHVEEGVTASAALERVAREYARVLGDAPDELLRERAFELEALASRLLERLAGEPSSPPPPGRILVGRRLTIFEAIELGASHGVGAVLSAPGDASPGLAVARALGLPVVCDVRALFQWAADGDRALVDGEGGIVVLNPSRVEVAVHRAAPRDPRG